MAVLQDWETVLLEVDESKRGQVVWVWGKQSCLVVGVLGLEWKVCGEAVEDTAVQKVHVVACVWVVGLENVEGVAAGQQVEGVVAWQWLEVGVEVC